METGELTAQPDPDLPVYPLRKLIMAHYAHAMRQAAGEQSLHRDELLGYLASIQRTELRPLQAVLEQTDAIGDPALPEPPQVAILEWLGEAFDLWQREYPLEQPLADEVRKLLPMASAIAITDPGFLTPGQHPLHRLLDIIQDYAIGWQPSLGRAGGALQKQVEAAIERACGWFGPRRVDLAATALELAQQAQRDQSRARRMAERLIATERGQQRAADARREAANMINAELMNFPGSGEVRDFLKGPWYESAQLVMLKFGADSDEWREMSDITAALLRSLQAGGMDRAQLLDLSSSLPGRLKHYLLSLQHDGEGADRAIKPIEALHLNLLRGSEPKLFNIDPILLQDSRKHSGGRAPAAIQALVAGTWYRVQHKPGETLRVQLALKTDDEQLLLFVNQAGVKALQVGYTDFTRLLDQKRAVPLRHGSSFSRCLVRAAGIESDEAFGELAAEEQQRRDARRRAEEEEFSQQLAQEEQARREQAEAEARAAAAEQMQREAEAAAERAAAELEEDALQQQSSSPARPSEPEREAAAGAERIDSQAGEQPADAADREQAAPHLSEEPEPEPEPDSTESDRTLSGFLHSGDRGDLFEEAQRLAELAGPGSDEAEAALAEAPSAAPDPEAVTPATAVETESPAQAPTPDEVEEEAAETWLAEAVAETPGSEPAPAAAAPGLDIPMGAWMGFHDGEAPLMAKLAVHDPELDIYIFVNREGIKMRQLSGTELRELVERQLVDILETRSSFRSDVDRVRSEHDK